MGGTGASAVCQLGAGGALWPEPCSQWQHTGEEAPPYSPLPPTPCPASLAHGTCLHSLGPPSSSLFAHSAFWGQWHKEEAAAGAPLSSSFPPDQLCGGPAQPRSPPHWPLG